MSSHNGWTKHCATKSDHKMLMKYKMILKKNIMKQTQKITSLKIFLTDEPKKHDACNYWDSGAERTQS